MTKDEALHMALEALELHGEQYPHMVKGYCLDAIAAIREALAHPPKREWVGLTDDEILADGVLGYHFGKNGGAGPVSATGKAIIEVVTAMLKERNT